jgi:hypothetical protein
VTPNVSLARTPSEHAVRIDVDDHPDIGGAGLSPHRIAPLSRGGAHRRTIAAAHQQLPALAAAQAFDGCGGGAKHTHAPASGTSHLRGDGACDALRGVLAFSRIRGQSGFFRECSGGRGTSEFVSSVNL